MNDTFSRATALPPGPAGAPIQATNVDATAERNESAEGEQTIWYTYTAPADGILVITHDTFNDSGSRVLIDGAVGRRVGSVLSAESERLLPPSATQSAIAFVLFKGRKLYLQYDHEFGGAAGAFEFTYRFATGGAVRVQGATGIDEFSDPAWRFREGSTGTMKFTVARIGTTEGRLDVNYTLDGLGTIAGEDFTPTSGTLQFAPGETQIELEISLIDNAATEGPKTFTLDLAVAADSGAVVIDERTEITVQDDEGAPVNDQYQNAQVLSGSSGSFMISGRATAEPGDPAGAVATVWYTYTAPGSGAIVFGGNRLVSVFTSPSGESLREAVLQFTDEVTGRGQIVTVVGGQMYDIMVDGVGEQAGVSQFRFEFLSAASVFRLASPAVRERIEASPTEDLLTYYVKAGETAEVTVERVGATDVTTTVDYATTGADVDPQIFEVDYASDDSDVAEPGRDFTPITGTLTFAPGEMTKKILIETARAGRRGKSYFSVALAQPSANSFVQQPRYAPVRIYRGLPVPTPHLIESKSGSYVGTITPDSGSSGRGAFGLSRTRQNSFTARALVDGKLYSFSGTFPPVEADASSVETMVTSAGKGSEARVMMTVRLSFDSLSREERISGTIEVGATKGQLNGTPVYDWHYGDNPASNAGVYTIALPAAVPAVPGAPSGAGTLSLRVSLDGYFVLSGTLADGTKVGLGGRQGVRVQSTFGDSVPTIVFGQAFRRGAGMFTGQFDPTFVDFGADGLAPLAERGDVAGEVVWMKNSATGGGSFTTILEPRGSRFRGIPPAIPMVQQLTCEVADVSSPAIQVAMNIRGNVESAVDSSVRLNVRLNAKTGLFSGELTAPDEPVRKISAAWLQNIGRGEGYLVRTSDKATGHVEIGPSLAW